VAVVGFWFPFFFSLLLSVLFPSPLLFFSFCSLAVAVLHGGDATVVTTRDWFQAMVLLLLMLCSSSYSLFYSFSHSLVVLLFLWWQLLLTTL
jgi:hypothetical protein